MSWDVLVQNYNGNPPAEEDELDGIDPQPLGSVDEIRQKIDEHLAGVVWSAERHGVLENESFTIEFDIGTEKPIDHVMLSVRGSGEALSALIQFAKPNRWSLFDISTSEFLDLDNPSSAGWEGFQAVRARSGPRADRSRTTSSDAKKPGTKRTTKKKKDES